MQGQKLYNFYIYFVCGFFCFVVYEIALLLHTHTGDVHSECEHISLKSNIEGNSISGYVISDFMSLFVYMVDDNGLPMTSQTIVENGVLQGKYIRGNKWSLDTSSFSTFPGAVYIVGVYANNSCFTDPLYINLPLNSYILGDIIDFDSIYVNIDSVLSIIMRGNTAMETQYYALFYETERFVLDSELFQDDNYVGLGKLGNYFTLDVTEISSWASFAYVGCRVENSKSHIIKILLKNPIVSHVNTSHEDDIFDVSASIRLRERPGSVNIKDNHGSIDDDSKKRSGSNSPIRIRNIQTIDSVIFVRCLLIGGPFDLYYMVRPESTQRGDPDEKAIMKYGEKAGSFNDVSFDIVITDYVSSVRNVIYIIAVKGANILGPTKRRFFP